ncbi:hypothetical protein AVEN_168300-1 [Araneus ventricosus]|uniref:Uncharacterized protein n=1 Tax=Araneus ventricosus TaxID=182803 RepID=A0A4Y2I7E6_ARAVE|nr:hypothetical protein AVEN_33544-1 [Araneus ventricosus]GBM73189.1 hypothetical protein AVEN_68651-1 [Araneus ventricosus]GBM73243.1 hypothetical protein AVEN_117042-1 [Araneus ventricosus]GBM73292.1 hypothetical protein AVEN_168300-1 [Araneus ventricosus]
MMKSEPELASPLHISAPHQPEDTFERKAEKWTKIAYGRRCAVINSRVIKLKVTAKFIAACCKTDLQRIGFNGQRPTRDLLTSLQNRQYSYCGLKWAFEE